jgi:hypothetical protein
MRRVFKNQTTKPQGDYMLKKITMTGFFVLSTAFLTAGSVSAHSAAATAKKAPVLAAPQLFCFYAMPC